MGLNNLLCNPRMPDTTHFVRLQETKYPVTAHRFQTKEQRYLIERNTTPLQDKEYTDSNIGPLIKQTGFHMHELSYPPHFLTI